VTSSDNTVGFTDNGFGTSRSLGCLNTTSSCAQGTSLATADNGVGTAGTNALSLASPGDVVNSGAFAAAGNNGMGSPTTSLSLTLTPNAWEHNATFNSGASFSTTAVALNTP